MSSLHALYSRMGHLLYAAILSTCCTSCAVALSQNPTSRYLKEMGRLLHDHQLHVVASPDKAQLEMESDSTVKDDGHVQYEENGWQYQPTQSLNMVAESQKVFETPRPPTDPYYRRQRELFQGYYTQNKAPNGQRQSKSAQPRRDDELFEALNGHIEALDQQLQTSETMQNEMDDFSPQAEAEWNYNGQNGYVEMMDGTFSSTDFGSDEAQVYSSAFESTERSLQLNGQFSNYEESSEAALRLELERLAAEKRAAEEAARRAEQQLRERERLERERLEQERITAARAEAARAELKKALERELARFEEGRARRKAAREPPLSIARSRRAPRMPETNDPFELLGLDYRNPPESVEDIRRAFVKMAKKYHPDAVAADATPEERERASLNFARINSAYQLLKEKQERLGDEYFATMLGGPMYEPRNSHIRQSFSRGYGFDDYSSIFSGSSYSARYGAMHGRQPRPQNGNNRNYHYGETRSPFRRNRREVGDNCHVSGKDFPPFFNT